MTASVVDQPPHRTGIAARIAAATPPARDRVLDGWRAIAIAGVVIGHWLVTAVVADGGTLRAVSPLTDRPWLAAASWLFQTLAVFFLVGGWAAARGWARARSRGDGYPSWLWRRFRGLFGPVLGLAVVWGVTIVTMLSAGAGLPTVRNLTHLVVTPLWFLLVFVALTAFAPVAHRINPVWLIAVVVAADAWRLDWWGTGSPASGWPDVVNLAAGWLVPSCLGARFHHHGLPGRRFGAALLVAGLAAAIGLVTVAGYPVSMVGVPGDGMSNLNPPSLAAVSFGVAQCGAVILIREPLRRVLRRPRVWAVVAVLNLSAITIFLWHQTAMLIVTCAGLIAGTALPGLHTAPDSPLWIIARIGWLPVFAAVLAVCVLGFRHSGRRDPTEPNPATASAGLGDGAD